MNTPLAIAGHGMRVADGSRIWTVAQDLGAKCRECLETGNAFKVKEEDVAAADSFIVISYGMASLWEMLHRTKRTAPVSKIAIIAGVPDLWLGQFKIGLWTIPDFVESAWCFDVRDIPISCTIRNADGPNVSVTSLTDIPTLATQRKRLNIRCDELFPPIMLPGKKHEGIIESEVVLQAVKAYMLAH